MITVGEILQEGFEVGSLNETFVRGNITISHREGMVTFIREWDNYHGVNVKIRSIETLRTVLSVIE